MLHYILLVVFVSDEESVIISTAFPPQIMSLFFVLSVLLFDMVYLSVDLFCLGYTWLLESVDLCLSLNLEGVFNFYSSKILNTEFGISIVWNVKKIFCHCQIGP
jgi:hypothetical protein